MSKKNHHKLQATRNTQSNQPRRIVAAAHYSGPIPAPDDLLAYEQVHPGLADRIMSMAEGQSAHRQNMERRVIGADTSRSMLGLIFAFLIVIGGLGLGTFLIMKQKSTQGYVAMLSPLGVVGAAFIYRQQKDKN